MDKFWNSSTFQYKDRIIAHIGNNTVVYKATGKLNDSRFDRAYAGELESSTQLSISSHTYDNTTSIGKITYNGRVGSFHSDTFRDSYGMNYIILPENTQRIGQEVFVSCRDLKSIYIPDSVKGLAKSASDNGSDLFNDCQNLKRIVVGSGCTQLGGSCFSIGNTPITGITFYSETVPQKRDSTFDNTGSAIIYVPCGKQSTYRSTWSDISSSRIQAIPPCTS